MTLDQFIQKYNGKKVNFDGAFGAQCVDLYRFYLKEVWNVPQTALVVGAHQIFAGLDSKKFYKEKNTPAGIPKPGDVITWSEGRVKNGHVAIVLRADINKVTVFEQNAPTNAPCRVFTYSYRHVIGWFRPLQETAPAPLIPAPITTPQKLVKQILVLTSHVPAQDLEFYKRGVANYLAKLEAKTGGELIYNVQYLPTDGQFYTIHGINTDNQPIVYVRPLEIGIEGRKGEIALKTEVDTVCLLYDPAYVQGDQPTNPVQNPITIEGFNPIQIPTTWVGRPANEGSVGAMEIFFSHEDSHSNSYIVNSEKGLSLRDKTHDSFNQTSTYSFMDYFLDLLTELKPHWYALTQGNASWEITNMIKRNEEVKIFTLDINGALFVCKLSGGRQLVGAAAANPNDLNEKEDDFGIELVDAAGNVKPADAKIVLPS